MQTSSSNFTCDDFDEKNRGKVIRGKYVCSGGVSKPRGAGTSATNDAQNGTEGAAQHIQVSYPALIGGTSVLAGLLQLLL